MGRCNSTATKTANTTTCECTTVPATNVKLYKMRMRNVSSKKKGGGGGEFDQWDSVSL